ncbi:hypothetical protein [Micromonospora sp. NPDC003816]|uniref:hypothetical protein n=1 Tax=Micromonospora sp. NPDC003816 TaxID=3364224 RepID=UPI003698CCC0
MRHRINGAARCLDKAAVRPGKIVHHPRRPTQTNLGGISEPSEYELAAWRDIQRFKGRPLSAAFRSAGEGVSNGAATLGRRAPSTPTL